MASSSNHQWDAHQNLWVAHRENAFLAALQFLLATVHQNDALGEHRFDDLCTAMIMIIIDTNQKQ